MFATISGSEREFVELPNWRALGMAAAPETDAEASARSVAGQTVERTDSRLYHRRCRWSCGQARWIDPALTSIMESEAWRRRERSLRGAEIHQRGGGPTGRLWTPEAGALVITSGAGGVKTQSFPGNRWAVLPGVERLRKWPKFAFHWGTAALHRESQSPCCQAIMGQLSIGAGFHTFLRRAENSGHLQRSIRHCHRRPAPRSAVRGAMANNR